MPGSPVTGSPSGSPSASPYTSSQPSGYASPHLSGLAQMQGGIGGVGQVGPGGHFGAGAAPGVQAFPVLAQGTRLLEQFIVESVLGEGGYCRVYLARDMMNNEIALKVLHSFGLREQLYRNLYEEYQAQAKIREIQHVVRADRPLQCRHENMDLVLLPMERAKWNMRGWLDETSSKTGDEARLVREREEAERKRREEEERKRREAGVPGQPCEPFTGMEFVWVPGGTFAMGDLFGTEFMTNSPCTR